MSVDFARAAFVRKDYRYETAQDVAVLANYPLAQEVQIDTNLSQASAAGYAADVLDNTKEHALAFEVEIEGIVTFDDFDGTVPHYTVDAPQYETDGRTYKCVGIEVDWATGTTTLRLRG